ncbi:SprT-like family protein [Arenibacter nanhaiticus]|uniref:SprT-like family protein n=1 Tax=Arenibacter nanhaiticus TaxID=558155 RepID=A0A1M6MUY4_9FLAO|nr:SprT-like domain-containing protein [Arenibacter nanhaiticus]SHJ87315.1 SprT-like family protein [Arenibacter nanhaiticus]
MNASSFAENPSSKFYGLFQFIFDYYNRALFQGQIKDCLIVITRRKNVMGHYSYRRWYHMEERETDELALNPSMFVRFPLIEICQTMVHEMCHGWQYHYGTPSRPGYHNSEWAQKMQSLGLMPSHNGEVGGKTTGQRMNDYPIKEGRFLAATEKLMNDRIFAGLYLEVNPEILSQITQDRPLYEQVKDLVLVQEEARPRNKKQKVKYSCGCSNVWGKPGLSMSCNHCGKLFTA